MTVAEKIISDWYHDSPWSWEYWNVEDLGGMTKLITEVAERGREHFSHLITQIVAMGDPDLSRVINLIEQDKWEEEEA